MQSVKFCVFSSCFEEYFTPGNSGAHEDKFTHPLLI